MVIFATRLRLGVLGTQTCEKRLKMSKEWSMRHWASQTGTWRIPKVPYLTKRSANKKQVNWRKGEPQEGFGKLNLASTIGRKLGLESLVKGWTQAPKNVSLTRLMSLTKLTDVPHQEQSRRVSYDAKGKLCESLTRSVSLTNIADWNFEEDILYFLCRL